jgi:pilus assembly protein FimV
LTWTAPCRSRSSGGLHWIKKDEIASQLDLAKAYVELGNTSEAKTLLDEIMSTGNDSQRQQARELLAQL